jgi:hypothetical protein
MIYGSRRSWADRNAFGEEAQKTMTPDTFSTQPLRSLDQFEAWREWHQPVLDFLHQKSTSYGFPAEVHLWKFGGLAMSRTSVSPPLVSNERSATSSAIPSIIGSSATASGARISRTQLGPGSKYPRKCHFSVRSAKNSCMSGRI